MNEPENIDMRLSIMQREARVAREKELRECGTIGYLINKFQRALRKLKYPQNAPPKGVWKNVDSLDTLSRYVTLEEMAELLQCVADTSAEDSRASWHIYRYQLLQSGEIRSCITRCRALL